MKIQGIHQEPNNRAKKAAKARAKKVEIQGCGGGGGGGF